MFVSHSQCCFNLIVNEFMDQFRIFKSIVLELEQAIYRKQTKKLKMVLLILN